jgi:hypothetical protein
MSPERQLSAQALFRFEHWKEHFRKDCEAQDKLPAFNCLGDSVLRLLWESGTEPKVQAIVNSVQNDEERKRL